MAKVLFNIDYSGQSNKAFTSVNYDSSHMTHQIFLNGLICDPIPKNVIELLIINTRQGRRARLGIRVRL